MSDVVIRAMLKAQGNRVPPAPRPPSAVDRRHIYLAGQANRTALELLQAASRDVNGYQIFVVPGTAAVARTKIKRPVFLVPGGIASSLELYELAIQGGSRVVVYALKNQRLAAPILLSIEDAGDGLSRLMPTRDLLPGEYALTPSSSNAAFVFAVD